MKGTTGQEIDPDGVNHPAHYNNHPSGEECISLVERLGFCLGSAVKYVWRFGLKDSEDPVKDLTKALWYLQRHRAMNRSERPVPQIESFRWDRVAAAEEDPMLREFYLAVRRGDTNEPERLVKLMLARFDDVPANAS